MKTRLHIEISRYIRGYFKNKLLLNYGKGILADTKNGLFVVDPRDFLITRDLLKNGEYNLEEIKKIKKLLNNNSTVIFVGCHIGTLLVPISKNVRKVYGFEANPKSYKLLNYNLLLNKIDNANIFNIAIGETEKQVCIKHNHNNTGNSSVNLKTNSKSVLINMKKLDSVITEKKIDMIIMDIEGYEVNAIKGAEKTLKNTKFFYVEYAPEQLEEFDFTTEDFINSLKNFYKNMCIINSKDSCSIFKNKDWINYLKRLPKKRGLLLNLLFTNEEIKKQQI